MKRFLTAVFLIICVASQGQSHKDTANYISNLSLIKYKGGNFTGSLFIPSYSRWGNDTLSKVPHQVKAIGNALYLVGDDGWWHNISGAGTTYTPGNGILISSGVIKADTSSASGNRPMATLAAVQYRIDSLRGRSLLMRT
jgi:hypothetical protein